VPRFSQGCSGGERGVATRSYLPLQRGEGREMGTERVGGSGKKWGGQGREGNSQTKIYHYTTDFSTISIRSRSI